jgi:hypothetical protein
MRGGHELRLAHHGHLLRPAPPIHRPALGKHRGDHIVAAVDVRGEVLGEVDFLLEVAVRLLAKGAQIPVVVVRVYDRQLRLEDDLRYLLLQPAQDGGVGRVRHLGALRGCYGGQSRGCIWTLRHPHSTHLHRI